MKGTWWIPLVLCCTLAFAAPAGAIEPPAQAWNVTLGGYFNEIASSVQQTSDGGYIVAGHAGSTDGDVRLNQGNYDIWVVKLDGTGQKVWNRTLGGSEHDTADAVKQTSDGGYIVAGYTYSNQSGDVGFNHGGADYWVVKLDGEGRNVWNRTLGGSGRDETRSVQQTNDGGYVVAGWTESDDGDVGPTPWDSWDAKSDVWVVKLDGAGHLAWSAAIGGGQTDAATAVRQTRDGGYIVAGYTYSSQSGDVGLNQGMSDFWVVKLDGTGTIAWTKTLGGSGTEWARAVDQTSDGGYIVAGSTAVDNYYDNMDCWVVKLDDGGQPLWNATLGGNLEESANSVQQTRDGGYIVAGNTYSNQSGDIGLNHGRSDCWVVKLDGAGQKVWNSTFGGSKFDYANAVQQTSDGGYVIAGGHGLGSNNGNNDFWVVKMMADSTGPGPAVLAVPGGTALPWDTDADGLYDDVNGNNRPDFADVVLYFNAMGWIAGNEPVGLFDYNGNERIDFADVVWLFNHL